jgi:hypothetical protein
VELGRQIAHPGTTVLLDDPGDVLLPLSREDVAGRSAGWNGQRVSFRSNAGAGWFRLVSAAQ